MTRSYILISGLVILLSGCQKFDADIENLNNGKVWKIGHGGMGIKSSLPINSKESVLRALYSGADGIEVDVQMSADFELVVFHDELLNESTNGKGSIIEYPLNEIVKFTYKASPYSGSSYPVLTLQQLLDITESLQPKQIILDCKLYHYEFNPEEYFEKFTNSLASLSTGDLDVTQIIILSEDSTFLRLIGEKRPGFKRLINANYFNDALAIGQELRLDGISMDQFKISESQVKTAHQSELEVCLWNAHSKSENIRALELNPDIMITSKLIHLQKVHSN